MLLLLALALVTGMVLFAGVRLHVAGPLMLAVFLAAAVMLTRALWRGGEAAWKIPPGLAGLVLFGVYLLCMLPRAAVPHEALAEGLRYASYVVAYWAWAQLAANRSRLRVILFIALLLGMGLCWYAIFQHTHHSRMVLWDVRPVQYEMRASGTHMCPNHLAHVLAVLMVLGLSLSAVPSAGWPLRIFGIYNALLALPILILTGSRSGWLGAVAGVSTLVLLVTAKKGWRRLAIILPLLLCVLAGTFGLLWMKSPLFKERIEQAIEGDVRPVLWRDTVDMIHAEPVTGHGGGSYRWVFPSFQNAFKPTDHYARYAHNEFLQIASEYGIVGAAILFAALVSFVARLLAVLVRSRDRRTTCFAAGLLGCMAATVVHALFDFNLHIFANSHLLAMVSGSLAGALFVSGDLQPVRVPRAVVRPAALAALAFVVVLMVFTVRATVSYSVAQQAEKVRKKLDFDRALVLAREAQKWDARDWRGVVEEAHVLKTQAFWNRDPEWSQAKALEARARYERALELNPLDAYTRMDLSRTLGDLLGDEEGAQALLNELITDAPANFEFRAELGLRLKREGKLEEAYEVFRSARRINPDDEMVYLNLRSLGKKLRAREKESE